MQIGVFGGSFDPIHNGHLRVAAACQQFVPLDAVLFVPAAAQPLKPQGAVAPAEDRVKMLELATQGDDRLQVSTIEIERGGVSYTVDTLRQLSRERSGDKLYLLLGSDAVSDLPNWREPDVIGRLATLVAVDRPGAPPVRVYEQGTAAADRIGPERVIHVPLEPLDVSSSEIRRRVACGDPIDQLVPPAVAAYIYEKHLYRDI